MKMIKYYISIICGLLTSTLLFADDITISAQLDTNQMRIGEQQNISLSIEYNSDKTLVLPDFGKELSHNILVVDTFSFQSTENKDKSIRKAKLPITCFDAGEYSFEIGPFIYGNDTVWSSPVQLSVQTVALDTTGVIKPIKPIRVPEYSFKDYLPKILTVVAIILVLALIAFVIWYVLKHKKPKFLPKKAVAKEKADIKALRELEQLKSQNLCEKEEYKNYYTVLTDILREYFGDVLSIDTFEKTSDEIIQEVVASGKVPLSVIQNLQMILKEADFVKFAKHKPTVETGNLHYGLSLFCINESKHLIQSEDETREEA
jgi:hypothetical protein